MSRTEYAGRLWGTAAIDTDYGEEWVYAVLGGVDVMLRLLSSCSYRLALFREIYTPIEIERFGTAADVLPGQ